MNEDAIHSSAAIATRVFAFRAVGDGGRVGALAEVADPTHFLYIEGVRLIERWGARSWEQAVSSSFLWIKGRKMGRKFFLDIWMGCWVSGNAVLSPAIHLFYVVERLSLVVLIAFGMKILDSDQWRYVARDSSDTSMEHICSIAGQTRRKASNDGSKLCETDNYACTSGVSEISAIHLFY